MKPRINKRSASVRRPRAAERNVAELLESRQLLSSVVFVGHDIADRASVPNLFPDAEVVFLDGAGSGLDEVTAALAGRSGLDSIAFFTHGAAGQIKLGNDALSAATLKAAAGWGKALNPDGDIIVWGCDVAAGSIGKAFIRDLAAITGADVAASTDVTGSTKLGGDWNLEFTVGAVAGLGIRGDYTGTLGVVYPVLHGAVALQPVDDIDTIAPFAGVSITDGDSTHVAGMYVVVSDMDNGEFTSSSLLASGFAHLFGNYFAIGGPLTLADAATALQALVFDPADNLDPTGQTRTTGFEVILRDSPTLLTASYNTTSIVAMSVNDAPAIGGAVAAQPTLDTNEVSPFATVTISDPDASSVTTTVTLDDLNKGVFTSASLMASAFFEVSPGVYEYVGSPVASQAAIRLLSFKPTENRVAIGQTETTAFTIVVDDGVAVPTGDATTTVVSESVNTAPTIGGAVGGHNILDNATVSPFSAVTIGDADSPAQTLDVTVTLDTPSQGGFTSASLLASGFIDTGAGTYTFSGVAADAQAAIRQLVFQPAPNRVIVGATETTTFSISVNDGFASLVIDTHTDVTATSANDAPTIGGAAGGQNVLDNATINPFSAVTFADIDSPAQNLDITVTIDDAAKGAFSPASLSLTSFFDMGSGVYEFTGTAAAAQNAIRQLVFVPAVGRTTPGNPETVIFSIEVDDTHAAPVTDSGTTVLVAASNAAPTISGIASFSGAIARERFTITYADLVAASSAVDPDNDAITFRIDSIVAGTLTKNDAPVTPGVTTLAIGESLEWQSAANASGVISAFTISAADGSSYSNNGSVTVNVGASNYATVAEGGNVDAVTDSTGRATVVTRNDAGELVILEFDPVSEQWDTVDLSGVTGVNNVTGDPRVFVDPVSGATYAAITTTNGVVLVWNDEGTWTSRNLTTELAGAPVIASNLVTFTTMNGEQVLAGLDADGDVAIYSQSGDITGSGPIWSAANIYDILRDQHESTPSFHSPLTVYVTAWNGLNIAGLDATGHIWTIWTGGGEGSLTEWHSSNLTQITGAAPLVGNVAAYTTEWGGINLAGIDTNGDLTVTWWVPTFDDLWVTTNMTQNTGGPAMQPGSLTAYVTPWNSLNITGLDADGEVVQYWWLPPPVEDAWIVNTLTENASDSLPRYTGRIAGFASSDNRLSVFGTSDEGHIIRLWWSPNTAWELENLTPVG